MRIWLTAVLLSCACGATRNEPVQPSPEQKAPEKLLKQEAPERVPIEPKVPPLSEAEHGTTLTWNNCRRPVLSGAPVPGSAKIAIQEVLTGSALAQCLSGDSSDLASAFAEFESNSAYDTLPPTDASCKTLVPSMRNAIQYEDACSPWVEATNDSLAISDRPQARRVSLVASLQAWHYARNKNSDKALHTLLSCVRFGHDIGRGGVEPLRILLGLELAEQCLTTTEHLLNSPTLALSSTAQWLSQAEALSSSRVHPASGFQADHEHIVNGLPKQTNATAKEKHERALMLAAMLDVHTLAQRSCVDASLLECYIRLKTRREVWNQQADAIENIDLNTFSPEEADRGIQLIIKNLIAHNDKAILPALHHVRVLHALKIHLHYRDLINKTKNCPSIEVFSQPPFATLMSDPLGDKPLEIRATDIGFDIWANQSLWKEEALWSLECGAYLWDSNVKKAANPDRKIAVREEPDVAPPPVNKKLQRQLERGIKKRSETHYVITRKLRNQMRNNSRLFAGVRIVPSIANHKSNGFKLYAIRPFSVWHRLGFRNGDRAYSVNGQPLTIDSLDNLVDAKSVLVQISRRGQPVEIRIDIR